MNVSPSLDATERNATEPIISEDIVRLALEACPNGVIITDSIRKILFANAEVERLFGYRREELLGQSMDMLLPPSMRAMHRGHRAGLVDDSEARRMGIGREFYGMRKDGTEVPVEIGLSPIRTDDGLMMLSAITDITERKRADEKFRLVVEACPCGMIMTAADGHIVLVNAEAERMFGYARNELLGKSIEVLVPAPMRAGHGKQRDKLIEQPAGRRMGAGRDLCGVRKDGTQIPVEIGLNTVRTGDGLMVLSALVDITERKQAEERARELQIQMVKGAQQGKQAAEAAALRLELVNAELEAFAHAASHDLKAPLRVIDNASKWLEEDLHDYLTGETRDNMNMLRGRVGRMEKLLDDLLEYSRIGRAIDGSHAQFVTGDVLMSEVLALVSLPQGFTVKVSPDFAEIRVPSMPLRQIMLNLVGNAIKHHDEDQGCIEVAVEDCGAHYAFTVKDDGPGIPPQFHEQIFKMFQTLRPRDQVEGSGMGLAMVRKNIEVYGGTLELNSAEGQGSTFHFTWPKRPAPERERA
jgi:PAS domain S-box-containing protein